MLEGQVLEERDCPSDIGTVGNYASTLYYTIGMHHSNASEVCKGACRLLHMFAKSSSSKQHYYVPMYLQFAQFVAILQGYQSVLIIKMCE